MRTLVAVQLVVTVLFGWGSLAGWAVAHAPAAPAAHAEGASGSECLVAVATAPTPALR